MEPNQPTLDFNDPEFKNENKKKAMRKPDLKIKSGRGRKSLKVQDEVALEIPEDEILFKKMYYSIGDVARMFSVNASLIRYWENEFDILKPKKNAKGDRHFRPEDIKNLRLIHHLLRERKYTIEGAKEFLKYNKNAFQKYEMIQSLQKLRSFLLELKASL
ncbi:MAG: MerR family transcriptional regulator [Ginsengibacter sp.]